MVNISFKRVIKIKYINKVIKDKGSENKDKTYRNRKLNSK